LKKKNQKTFALEGATCAFWLNHPPRRSYHPPARCEPGHRNIAGTLIEDRNSFHCTGTQPNNQKFFASFFSKKKPYFLHQTSGITPVESRRRLPVTEIAADPNAIRTFVKAADELGYTHLLAYDHVVKASHEGREPKLTGPYTEKHSFHDPFVFFGFVAALTDRLGFVTGVMVLPQRQTALVAQQAADVDLLSGQRLRLGVGIG